MSDLLSDETTAAVEEALGRVPRAARPRFRPAPTKVLVVGADALVIALAVGVGLWAAAVAGPILPGHLALAAAALPLWLACFARRRLYHARIVDRRPEEARRVLHATVSACAWLALLAWGLGIDMPRRWLLATAAVSIIGVLAERECLRAIFRHRRRDGRSMRRVLIAGAVGEGEVLCAALDGDPDIGYQVVGFIDDVLEVGTRVANRPVLASSASAVEAVQRAGVDTVVIASSAAGPVATNHLARALTRARVHVELTSTLHDIAVDRLTLRNLGGRPVAYLEPLPGGWRPVAKRVFDVAMALAALAVVMPVCLVIALLVKLDSRGPVVFRQRRVGRDGQPFHVLKFRTMVKDAEHLLIDLRDRNEADGPLFKLRDDPRVTRVGRLLRRTSLDELPQLWNVVKGEMSLVGPRPALPDESELWDAQLRERLRVRPGITGMWQVSGRSDSSFERYSRLDLYYVDNWSPVLDAGILLRTIPTVLFSRGAY